MPVTILVLVNPDTHRPPGGPVAVARNDNRQHTRTGGIFIIVGGVFDITTRMRMDLCKIHESEWSRGAGDRTNTVRGHMIVSPSIQLLGDHNCSNPSASGRIYR